jgi:hypothetical protein
VVAQVKVVVHSVGAPKVDVQAQVVRVVVKVGREAKAKTVIKVRKSTTDSQPL